MNNNIRFLLLGHYNHEGDYNLGMSRSIDGALAQRVGSYDHYTLQVWDVSTCEYLGDVNGDVTAEMSQQTEFSDADLKAFVSPY